MDPNGNLNYAERRALRPGDRVVYQTEALAHRGEMTGAVSRVCQDGGVWIGTHGARYALLSDYVRRADWTPEKSSGAAAREEFLRDIEPTREMVAKWPEWKRKALGPVPAAPNFPPVATPEAARRAVAPKAGKGTPREPDAPAGQETASVEALQARVAALTADRDIVYCQIAKLRCVLREIESVLTGGVR